MNPIRIKFLALTILIALSEIAIPQSTPEYGDPPHNPNIPEYYKSKLSDIEAEITGLKKGKAKIIATSPGELPVYAIYYGEKDNLHSQANYNSALGARNPAYFAKKDANTKPVVFFIGPVHGQEVEGIVGMVNLIHLAETGKDHRGREWPELIQVFNQCRVIIIPCGNPDGRARCPYNSFVGLPVATMTKYGQGTKKDGTPWGWPTSKSVHPMKGNVGILGCYYNNNGINIMHDEFFSPMAEETKAIFKIAMEEAPDMTVTLHSCECQPFVFQTGHTPYFMKKRIADFAKQLNQSYINKNLPNMGPDREISLADDDPEFPPKESFNLASALHHASGTMPITFESPHGTLDDGATHEEILDIQLVLYQEMFDYILKNQLYWELPAK